MKWFKNAFVMCFILLSISCSPSDTKGKIRDDLFGKPLTTDDYYVIKGNKLIPVFVQEKELNKLVSDLENRDNLLWKWSFFDKSKGMRGYPNTEYYSESFRYVFFKKSSIKMNEYFSLGTNAMTIRGIQLGDRVNLVLERYGTSYFNNESKKDFLSGSQALQYRRYLEEGSMEKYPTYDYLQFEIQDGIVVRIHFWKNSTDAE